MEGLVKLIFFISILCNIHHTLTLRCQEHQLLCGDGKRCIYSSQVCNYVSDCDDSSDEVNFDLCKAMMANREHCPAGSAGIVECSSNYRKICLSITAACSEINCRKDAICKEIEYNKLKPNWMIKGSLQEASLKDPTDISYFYKLFDLMNEACNETRQGNFTVCPPFYVPFEDNCFSFLVPSKATWSEAKRFCEYISGRLAVLDDINKFKDVLNYIQLNDLEIDFWIGGQLNDSSEHENSTLGWTWLNKKRVEMGAPFWSLGISQDENGQFTSFTMRPNEDNVGEKCLGLLKENHYYFSDENCDNKFSPLCIAENGGK